MKNTQPRKHRINSAREWVKTYSGNYIVKSYSKKYAVDKVCAINELRFIGVEISQEYEIQIRRSIEDLKKQKQLRKEKREQELNSISDFGSDENFAFIAGYTSGGFPYGITYEEMGEIDKNDLK